MMNQIEESEKTRKPKLSRTECIQHLCSMADERTNLLREDIKSGSAKSIKATDIEGKQIYFHRLNSKVADALYDTT